MWVAEMMMLCSTNNHSISLLGMSRTNILHYYLDLFLIGNIGNIDVDCSLFDNNYRMAFLGADFGRAV